MKAIDEIKNLTAESPTSPESTDKYSFPPSRPSLLDLMKNVHEEPEEPHSPE